MDSGRGERQSEKAIQTAILAYLGEQSDLLAWRNNVGFARYERVTYGLAVGSADIVGVGPGGIFFAFEVKSLRGRPTDEQINWLERVVEKGGVAAVVRSVAQVKAWVEEMRARTGAPEE